MRMPESVLNGSICILCGRSIAKVSGLNDAPDGEPISIYRDGEFDGGAWAHFECAKGYTDFDLTGRPVGGGGDPYWFPVRDGAKLPEIGTPVWVWLPTCTDGDAVGLVTVGKIGSFAYDNAPQWKVRGSGGVAAGEAITHWMPMAFLPPPPQ